MCERKKVSICIPVYNAEEFISSTIQSVLDQTYTDFELIVSDNQSTDDTMKKIMQFSDKRIVVFENDTNVGMFENWNLCLKRAKGEYIHLLCADDYLEPTAIEKMIGRMEKNSNAVFVFNDSNVVNEVGKIIMKRTFASKDGKYDGREIAKKAFKDHNIFGEPSNVMFRRDIAKKVGGFSEKIFYSSDWDYWTRLAMHGDVEYIAERLTNFRVSQGTGTSKLMKQWKKLIEDDQRFVDDVTTLKGFELSSRDIREHKLKIRLRLIAKMIFSFVVK